MASESLLKSFSMYLPTLPDPNDRLPFTPLAGLPFFSCYYIFAVLAILPNTFLVKLALLPVIAKLGWHISVDYDAAGGFAMSNQPAYVRMVSYNYGNVVSNIYIVMRAVEWTFLKEPLKRVNHPTNGDMTKDPSSDVDIKRILIDAADLASNQRGHGWTWSHKTTFPAWTSPPTIGRFLWQFLYKFTFYDMAIWSIEHFFPEIQSAAGASIFNAACPAPLRYARAAYVTTACAFIVYSSVDVLYLATAIVSCIFLRLDPVQWPPTSDRPWLSTSLKEFWGRRWHQFFRHVFVSVGARPMAYLFGRVGFVLGSFAMSALVHDWGMWSLGRGTEPLSVGGFFIMMGVGVAMEDVWERMTRKRVGGTLGWVWTMGWILAWGSMMVDAWTRRSFVGANYLLDAVRPGKVIAEFLFRLLQNASGWNLL